MHEWPLIIFTLLMQASIGCVATSLICYRRILASLPPDETLTVMKIPLLSAFVLGGFGLLASVLHLGNPLHMFYTLLNVADSWMSREVLVTGLYMALLFIVIGLLFVRQRVSGVLLAATALIGLLDVFVMSAIYANTLFNFWRGGVTFGGFYGTSLLLGGIVAGATLVSAMKNHRSESNRVLRISLVICGVGLLLLLISATSLLTQLGQPGSLGITEKLLPDGIFSLNLMRIGLIGVGLFIALRSLFRNSQNRASSLSLSLSALFILAGETLGRYAFFSFVA